MIIVKEEEIKKIQLDLLKKFKEICEENNFKYYLFFGTLIGAIRHSGFIPWDDDIDLIMPRVDYEKFINYCYENEHELYPCGVVHYRKRKKYAITIAKFENKEYVLYDNNGMCCEIGVNIDIYPLDAVGNSKNDIVKATKRFLAWKDKEKFFKKHGFVSCKNKTLNKIRYAFFLFYEFVFDVWVASLDKKCKKKKLSDYKYCGIPVWQPDIGSYFDKDLLNEAQAEFEGDVYPIPGGYDVILRQIYGDYMVLPPIESRVPYHMQIVYKKD